jgi:hypothetical protein
MWWYMPVIPALRRQRQEDHKIEASLGCIWRPCLKTTQEGGREGRRKGGREGGRREGEKEERKENKILLISWGWGCGLVVECLPSLKCEALIPSPASQNKANQQLLIFLEMFFFSFIIHMCIQGLGHFSPLPPPPFS